MVSNKEMAEKRKFVRVEPAINPVIYDASSNKFLGTMVDLSVGGLKIASAKEMVQGKDYLLKIILKDENDTKKTVLAKVNVRWSYKGSNPGFFFAGCIFTEVEARGRLNLAKIKTKQRKARRVSLVNYPIVYDADANKLVGSLIDISVDGIKLFSYNEMVQFKNYFLKIISLEKNDREKSVVVKANVRWCNKGNDTNIFSVGCVLREVQEGGSLKLSDLMLPERFAQ